ncbi:MAG: glycosyltransferase family 39 protein [Planctomycetota bacterium]
MLAWTWRAWPDAVIDFGREVYVPWRLYEGDKLYSDVAYFNGPLSPHVNLFVFRILGPRLDSIFIANFLFHVAIAALVYAIVRFITNARCGLFCLFALELLFAYAQYLRVGNYNFMAPYAHELTHGLLLSLASLLCARYWITTRKLYWALGGGIGMGLVFLTKPEIFLAIALAWIITLVIVGLQRNDSWQTAISAGIVLLGSAGCVFMVAVSSLRGYIPWRHALYHALGGWVHVFDGELTTLPFYQVCTGFDFPVRRLVTILLWFILELLLLLLALRKALPATRTKSRKVYLFLLLAVGALLLVQPQSMLFVNAFSALPLWLVAGIIIGLQKLWRAQCEVERDRLIVAVVLGSFALGLLAKMLLHTRIYHYGFALAMPGVLTVMVMCWHLMQEVRKRGGSAVRFTTYLLAFFALVSLSHLVLMNWRLSHKREYLPVANSAPIRVTNDRANAYGCMLAHIEDVVAENETVAVWPEGSLLNFLTRRPNSTPYAVLMPPEILMFGEKVILNSYRENSPDYVLLIHRDTSEYGVPRFGADYAEDLWAWLFQAYVPVHAVGEKPFTSDEFGMLLLQRKSRVDIVRRDLEDSGPVAIQRSSCLSSSLAKPEALPIGALNAKKGHLSTDQ